MEDIFIPVETEDVIPDAPAETTVEETTEVAEDTTPAAEVEETTETAEIAEESAPITIPIRFNHETKSLSIDEAATLAQKGMAAETVMSKLRYLAASSGKSPTQVIEEMISADEEMRKNEILEKVNGDEELAKQFLDANKSKYQKLVDEMIAAENSEFQKSKESINDKLAYDFIKLQKEFPEMATVDKVPESVLKDAIDKNISLYDAYLRFQRKENKNIKATTEKQEVAAQSSTGSAKSAEHDGTTPEIEALMQGLWG